MTRDTANEKWNRMMELEQLNMHNECSQEQLGELQALLDEIYVNEDKVDEQDGKLA